MKRLLLMALVAMMLAVTASTNVLAGDEDEVGCPCGVDEEGQCLPCPEPEEGE